MLFRSIWGEVKGYDESLRQGYEDWEFNIRLGQQGYFGFCVTRPLFHYRVRGSGMLISKSNRLHGLLWSEIQTKHKSIYKLSNLYRLWKVWSKKPSNHPLVLYFIWFGLHRLLSPYFFSILFKSLRAFTDRRRKTATS